MWTELNTEFMYRYNKNVPHESFRKLEKVLEEPPKHMYDSGFCEPYPRTMPDDVKYDSSIKSYHEYYIKYKPNILQSGLKEENLIGMEKKDWNYEHPLSCESKVANLQHKRIRSLGKTSRI